MITNFQLECEDKYVELNKFGIEVTKIFITRY